MTQFIGVNDLSQMVGTMGPHRFIRRLVDNLAEDFGRWEQFDKVARVASHSPIGVIELMPTSDGALYSFKYVNGHPSNPKQGKLTVTAFGVLSDVATGYPLLISEMTLLTALRTAATSAYAAKLLARPESRVMALIGAGAQSEFQTLAFQEVMGIREVVVFDPDPAAVEKYMRNAAGFGLTLRAASSVEAAVAGADIVTVCTAVKGRQALVLGAIARARPSSIATFSRMLRSSWSSPRRRASRAKSSRWGLTLRSRSCGRSRPDAGAVDWTTRRSRYSTQWALPWKTFPHCGWCTT